MRYNGPRKGRGAKTVLLILLAAIVVGGVAGLALGRLPLPRHASVAPKTPGSAAKVTPGQEGPNKLVISESELTKRLRDAAGENARNAQVTLEPGRIVISGSVQKGALALPLRVALEPFIENGSLSVVVREGTLGGIALPRDATVALAGQVKHVLYQEQQKIKGLVLDTVEVKDKQLTLTGHFREGAKAGKAPG